MRRLGFAITLIGFAYGAMAQKDKGVFSGNFQGVFNGFMVDSALGITEKTSTQYGTQKSSSEAFLFANYSQSGFAVSARFDLFNNSNLLNPTGSFSGQGLGFWQISKEIDKLKVTAGYFYEQFGSGIVFRAYEDRLIGIDYAMQGVNVKYTFTDNFSVKAFTGRQKGFQENRFGLGNQVVKGVNAEGSRALGNATFDGGTSLVNRTLDQDAMNSIAAEINSLALDKRFYPKYNVYAYNAYFTMGVKDFTYSVEFVGKTKEAVRNQIDGLLENKTGQVLNVVAGYAKSKLGKKHKSGIGANLQYRYMNNYSMTLTPNVKPLEGLVAYVPSLTQQSTYRLLARYSAQAITNGEQAIQADFDFTINKENAVSMNVSDIKQLDGAPLYREYYFEYSRKVNKNFKVKSGVQSIFYNQAIYQGKPGHDNVETKTMFVDANLKINKKTSIRVDAQYLHTNQDYGSFANGIVELNFSPHYSFAISDMVNVKPHRYADNPVPNKVLHYYSIFGKYSIHATAFTLGYIKQVEGVNCSGGVCRLEPGFSGVRFTLTTNF